jgi:NitT/TauT family transport system substrate-binding protein
MRRSDFLSMTAAAGIVAGSGAAARSASPLRIASLPFDQSGQAYYAQDLDIFTKAGLTCTIQTINNGSQIAAAIAGGSLDIGQANVVALAEARERGLGVSIIAGAGEYHAAKPTALMLVEKNSPLRDAKDFSAKTVAVGGLKTITQVSVQAWIDEGGGNSELVKFIEMPFPQMEAALADGRIDGALLAEPDASAALALGHTRVIAKPFDAIGKNWLIGGWFAKDDWIAANTADVKKFVAAMRTSAQWANAHQAASAQILEKYTKVHVGNAARVQYAETLDPRAIQPQIDAAVRYHLFKAAFPAKTLVWPAT